MRKFGAKFVVVATMLQWALWHSSAASGSKRRNKSRPLGCSKIRSGKFAGEEGEGPSPVARDDSTARQRITTQRVQKAQLVCRVGDGDGPIADHRPLQTATRGRQGAWRASVGGGALFANGAARWLIYLTAQLSRGVYFVIVRRVSAQKRKKMHDGGSINALSQEKKDA
jgi:hypothetical protein